MKKYLYIIIFLLYPFFILCGQNIYTINDSLHGIKASPRLYGIFFEEINHAGEGGLYAEMVLNRDFEITDIPDGSVMAGNLVRTKEGWLERKVYGNDLYGWKFLSEGGAKGDIRLQSENSLNKNNPASMRLIVTRTGSR